MPSSNRVAIITGASSGIGWALAKTLAAEGWKAGLVARRLDKLATLAEEISASGGTASVAAADVGDRGQVNGAVQQLTRDLGPVDLLIANAGVGMPTLLEPVNVHDVESMFRVNVLGMVYSIDAVLPDMLKRNRGHLAAISSLAAYKGLPGESAYCASKAAINSYMEGLRIHVRNRGIQVSTICPGFVRTPMTAVNEFHMPWALDADQAAVRIVRALRRKKKVYNFPWQTALLMKLTAWAPDWIMAKTMQTYNENPPMPIPSP